MVFCLIVIELCYISNYVLHGIMCLFVAKCRFLCLGIFTNGWFRCGVCNFNVFAAI